MNLFGGLSHLINNINDCWNFIRKPNNRSLLVSVSTMASTLSGDVDQSLTKAERDIKRHLCQGPNEDNIIAIESEGDLLIKIDGQPGEPSFYYRVSSIVLQKASPYFDRLLDPKKFSEGVAFGAQIEKLKESYPDITTVPAAALPMIQVSDVGQIPARYPSKNVVTHFFDILHDTNSFWIMTGSLPNHIALLAILADRFDATKPVLDYINDQGWTHAHKETKENKKESSLSSVRSKEILWRQRMFAGVILGVQDWVMSYSRLLIDAGSERWKVASDTELKIDDEAPWWYLPRGLEGKIVLYIQSIFSDLTDGRGIGIPSRGNPHDHQFSAKLLSAKVCFRTTAVPIGLRFLPTV